MRIVYSLVIAALQMTLAPEVALQMRGGNSISTEQISSLPPSATHLDLHASDVTVVYKG